jgi:hypothetical protein
MKMPAVAPEIAETHGPADDALVSPRRNLSRFQRRVSVSQSRRPRRRRWQSRRITPESSLIRTILDGCTALRVPCWRLNTGAGVVSDQRDPNDEGRWVAFGFPGCPDLVALLPGRTLWIECKSRRGTLRPYQVDFRNLCLARGIPHCVARSWEDVEVWVK